MRLLSLTIAVLLASAPALAEDVEAELKRMTNELLDAVAPGDTAVWDRYAHERLIYVSEASQQLTKKQLLEEMKPLPKGPIGDLEAGSFEAEVHGDVAVTIGSQALAVLQAPPAATLSRTALCEYNGVYRLTPEIVTRIACADDGLTSERTGRPAATMKPEVRDVFFQPGRPRTRRIFFRDERGAVTGFADRREGLDVRWTKAADTSPAAAPDAGDLRITWLGHAAFEIVSPGGTKLLIDPFLTENPATPAAFKDLSRYKPQYILVTHSHGDHLGDTIAIAKRSSAKIVAVNMPALYQKEQVPEELIQTINVGGTVRLGDTTVRVVPAMHGSEPSGRPVGFVIEFAGGRSVYHQGDTWIFGDMALIEELYHPTIILMNAGGKAYGQSPEVGLMGIDRWFRPKVIIPMHYASMPTMSTEEEVRRAIGHDRRVVFMKPGETRRF